MFERGYKFSILLMKNNKFSYISPLNKNDEIFHDSNQKSELIKTYFALKSNLSGSNDNPPNVERLQNIPDLTMLNTSPFEVDILIRNLK